MAIARAPAATRSTPTARRPTLGRTILAFAATGMFFGVAAVLTCVVWLAARVHTRDETERAEFTRRLNRGFLPFAGFIRDAGFVGYSPCELPAAYEDRPVLVVANHPSLIDVVLLLPWMPRLVTVVKESWYRSWVLGAVLRETDHIPGPGHASDAESKDMAPVVERIAAALESGAPVLAFPEGTRSRPDGSLRRLRRGSIEAAVRAGVDVLPLFIEVDRPFLTKGQPMWRVPRKRAHFAFEWLPPISTRGGDAQEITRRLGAMFGERLRARRRGDEA